MRKLAFLIGGLVLVTCLIAGAIYHARRTTRIEAIREALSADTALARRLFGTRSMVDADMQSIKTYTQELRRIDMSRCPRDFQLAYLEHIQAWEALAQLRAPGNLLGPLIKFVVTENPFSLLDGPDDQPNRRAITQTWNEIKRIALTYGIRLPQE